MTYSNKAEETFTFEEMFEEIEKSGELYIEWAKSDIAEQIVKAMKQAGISKAELARRLGKSRALVTLMLQGSTNFTIETLVKIAETLNCQLEIKLNPKVASSSWEDFESDRLGGEWKNNKPHSIQEGKITVPVNNNTTLAA